MEAASTMLEIEALGAQGPAPDAVAERCIALDALRGFVMLALSWGLLARSPLLEQPSLRSFALQLHHVDWEGAVFWDLIQPAFWFVVGAALPFALARRLERGATFGKNLRHVLVRVLKLMVLGQILICLAVGRYQFLSRETLTQIGFCYFWCFLIWHLRFRWQVAIAACLTAVNWALYVMVPGSAGPWSPGDNIGAVVDQAVFGAKSDRGWVTLNVLGSTVTMLFGVWTGAMLRGERAHREKLKILVIAGCIGLVAGFALSPLTPIMQKLWTASYTLYTAGYVLLTVGMFYWLFDIRRYSKPAFPLVVVGMNSIFIYALSGALGSWIDNSVAVFSGRFRFLGPFGPVAQASAAVFVMWYVCYWLYQRRIFFKA
ncbi:MAG: hypothetical protein HY682_09210 [Chloroflexi bacterium]|nr:hypothetical protein [Chloroflexota bacterium]